MSSAELLFGLVAGALGSGVTLAAFIILALVKRRYDKKNPQPTPEELLEFRAWKVVNHHSWGGKGLYRDIVHRWNVLERERDDARHEARQFKMKTRRLEERVSQFAAERCESPLIQIVTRARPREIARL